MPTTVNSQVTPVSINAQNTVIVNGTGNTGTKGAQLSGAGGTGLLLAFTAGANGARVISIQANNDDSNAYMIGVWRYDGTNTSLLWSVNVPAHSGLTSGTANVDLMASPIVGNPLDASDKPVLGLNANDRIYVGSQTTVTSTQNVGVFIQGENF